jgi:hypothetical protein
MPDPTQVKCSVCGAIRSVDEMLKYAPAPKSTSGLRVYRDIWYCADKNHSQSQLARIAARMRP